MAAAPVADRELSFPCVQSCNPLRSAVRDSYSTGLLLCFGFRICFPMCCSTQTSGACDSGNAIRRRVSTVSLCSLRGTSSIARG